MKTTLSVLGILFSLVVMATPVHAAASCNEVVTPSCPGVVCYGYTGGHWQTCVPRNVCDLFVDGCNPCRTMECYPPWEVSLP